MEFHSEWLLEDPIEVLTDINKEVYSKDEIEKLSTKENLSEIDKSFTLLESGQISQKLWVVENLHNIMQESRFHEIIAELINRLPYWNESSQEIAGKSLITVIRCKNFPIKYAEHLLNLSLQIIDSESWPLQLTWGQLVAELLKHVPEKVMTRYTQEALSLSAFNQSDEIRSVGGIILGSIVEIKKKPPGEITRKIFSLSQDPSNFVRKNMCGTLRILFRLSGEFQNSVMGEIIKLVGDECAEVLEESLQLFVDVLPMVSDKDRVLVEIEEYFVNTRFDKLVEIKLRYIGRILSEFRETSNEKNKEKWVDWVENMVKIGGISEKRALSISIGGLIKFVNLSGKILGLWSLLENENDLEINNNLILLLGFLATYSADKREEVKLIGKKYLKDHENNIKIIEQFGVIAKEIQLHEEILTILIGKCSILNGYKELLVVLNQLIFFASTFECIERLKPLVPSLMEISKKCVVPIKQQSLELLAIILYKSPGYSCKINLSKEIINNFANSTVSSHRVSFINFCLCIKNLCSKDFFCKVFMNSLLSLAKDEVKEVKYAFAKNFTSFRYLIPVNNNELESSFRYILNCYLEIDDKILLEYALIADESMNTSNWEKHYGKNSENIENQRIKLEQIEETKETIEMEKLKKVQNEGNPRKNMKKFQVTQNTKGSRQSSVKPIKKYNLSEADKYEIGLNRTILRTFKKK